MKDGKMEKKISAAAFDLDGTVLLHGELRPAVREALLKLKHSGVVTTIASGRDMAQISSAVRDCFCYCVAANGACVIDNARGELLFGSAMDRELVLMCVDAALKAGGAPVIFHCGKMTGALKTPLYMPGGSLRSYIPNWLWYSKKARFVPFMGLCTRMNRKKVYKIQVYFRDEAACTGLAEQLGRCGKLEVLDMGDKTVEITMAGVTKAAALEKLCAHAGCGMEALAAFGDSKNDMNMLMAAGFAVAMDNAADYVKALADYIAPDVREDGAAAAIYDIFGL